jgi:hypothetical protein
MMSAARHTAKRRDTTLPVTDYENSESLRVSTELPADLGICRVCELS